MILDRNGKLYQSLPLSSPGAVTVSPTGRYIMTADENNRVELYQSVLHQSAEDYLEKLRLYGAEETARRFQNQLSDIPASSKAFDWNNENKILKILEESLKVAESTQQWSEAEGLAQEILILDPKNSQAKATLKLLKDNQDGLILEKGIKLLEEKQYAEAISLFKKISQDSPMYSDARNLIDSADRDIQAAFPIKNTEEQPRFKNKLYQAMQNYNQHIQTMIQPRLQMFDPGLYVRIELQIGVSGKIIRYKILEASPYNEFNQAAQLAVRNVNLDPLPEALAENPPYIVVVKVIPQLQ